MSTQIFPSTRCNQVFLDEQRREALDNEYQMPDDQYLGYILINNKLVPESFVYLVKEELSETFFEFQHTLSEDCVFSKEFLASLHNTERDVLMSVLLILIERGDVMLNVWGELE